MSWIETINTEDWDGEPGAMRDRVADPETGEVDHIMAVHSLNARSLAAHDVLYDRIADGLGVTVEPGLDND